MSHIKFKKQEIKLLKYLEKEIIMLEKLMYKKQIIKKYSYNNLEIKCLNTTFISKALEKMIYIYIYIYMYI